METQIILTLKNDWEEMQFFIEAGFIKIKDNGEHITRIKKQDWESIKNFIDLEIEKNG
jgi:hypothetical protein